MASGQKPRMSLPPELSAIDDGWGEEEQPTIARPSRMPTAPVRDAVVVPPIIDAPAPALELDVVDQFAEERVTTVPEIPLDEYARRMMRDEQVAATEAPPPPGGEDAFVLELDARETETLNEAAARALRNKVYQRSSEAPTAPPPSDFDMRAETVPRAPRIGALSDVAPTDPPPPISSASAGAVFSGRFSSLPPQQVSPQRTMKDRFAMGDFSGALEIAESILAESPSDLEAKSLASKCREVLQDMYTSRINGMDRVPNISMTPDQIRWLSLDHREGFMLSMIDGISSVDDLLDVSGMQRLDALRILCSLLDQKVIALG